MVPERELALIGMTDTIDAIATNTVIADTVNTGSMTVALVDTVYTGSNVAATAVTVDPGSKDVKAEDSIVSVEPEPHFAVLLTPPQPVAADMRPAAQWGISFILTALFLLFFIVALRFRNNIKYAASIFRNLVEVRTRHNVFDDTVRETSLVVLLNILWCVSAGVILYGVYTYLRPDSPFLQYRAADMGIGMIAAVCYTIFMCIAYYCIGWIFTDAGHAKMWLKGFTASQGLMSPAFFVIALLAICYPASGENIFIAAVSIFILVKLILIWKGYKIFFTQISSWVLFLCYLCSLEIVPLLFTYRLAILLGDKLA